MAGLIPPEEMTDESAQPVDGAPVDDLAAVRDLIVRTHADAVPELIGGATIGELIASIAPAREAYARIAAQLPARPASSLVQPVSSPAMAPRVPAGGTGPAPLDPAKLSPAEKIRRALAG